MLKPFAITRRHPHRTVQREAVEIRTQRPLHEWLVACAATKKEKCYKLKRPACVRSVRDRCGYCRWISMSPRGQK
jgi:hypothetical protein